jgi:hypothetical protein
MDAGAGSLGSPDGLPGAGADREILSLIFLGKTIQVLDWAVYTR